MAKIDKQIADAEAALGAAEAAYAAWQADKAKVKALAEAVEAQEKALVAQKIAHKARIDAENKAGVRLGVFTIVKSESEDEDAEDDRALTDAFVAAVEKAVGWPKADYKALVPGNNPRSDPWNDAAWKIANRIIAADPGVKRADDCEKQAYGRWSHAQSAMYDLQRVPDMLGYAVTRAKRELKDLIAARDDRKEAQGAVVNKAAQAAQKACAELIDGTRKLDWPVS